MDPNERKSVWKMNYKMKNEMKQKEDKTNIIVADLMPNVNKVVVEDMWNFRHQQIDELCTKIDKFEESHHEINDELK